MSDDERELSEQLRERVAELYAPSRDREAQLGLDAQRRVIQHVTREAQGLRRTWQLRSVGAASALLLSAAAAFWLMERPREAARVETNAPSCGLPLVKSEREFEALPTQRRLSLGRYGALFASDDAHVSIERSDPCQLVLRFERGVVAGDLHSLVPARIRIQTPQGEVVVTGTRFAVRAGDEFEVLLASGVVDVVFADRSSLRLSPGMRLRKAVGAQAPERAPLTAADLARLSGLVGGAVRAGTAAQAAAGSGGDARRTPVVAGVQTAPAPSTKPAPLRAVGTDPASGVVESNAAPLAAAEAARRAGRIADARVAYRTASRGHSDSAEIALLRWVRLELEAGDPAAAQRLLAIHQQRYAAGHLGAEAGWQQVQVWQALGRPERARQAARELLARYGETPQAAGARQLLEAR